MKTQVFAYLWCNYHYRLSCAGITPSDVSVSFYSKLLLFQTQDINVMTRADLLGRHAPVLAHQLGHRRAHNGAMHGAERGRDRAKPLLAQAHALHNQRLAAPEPELCRFQ